MQRGDSADLAPPPSTSHARASGPESLAHQAIDADQKRGQRFSGACRSGDERGFLGENVRPALLLRLGGCAEAADKPIVDERVCPFQARGDQW
jgi:hypothetical protein